MTEHKRVRLKSACAGADGRNRRSNYQLDLKFSLFEKCSFLHLKEQQQLNPVTPASIFKNTSNLFQKAEFCVKCFPRDWLTLIGMQLFILPHKVLLGGNYIFRKKDTFHSFYCNKLTVIILSEKASSTIMLLFNKLIWIHQYKTLTKVQQIIASLWSVSLETEVPVWIPRQVSQKSCSLRGLRFEAPSCAKLLVVTGSASLSFLKLPQTEHVN